VSFYDEDRSTLLKMEEVAEGEVATPPDPPSKTGYDFSGWSGIWQNVTADETVIATYKPKHFIVTFNAMGGQASKLSAEVVFDSTYGQLPGCTKDGCSFIGWQLPNGTIASSQTKVKTASNHELKAVWSEQT